MLYLVSTGWYFRMDNNITLGIGRNHSITLLKNNVKKNSHKFVKKTTTSILNFLPLPSAFPSVEGHVVSGIDLFFLTLTFHN